MNKFTDFSLKNVAAIIIISVILFVAGTFSATTLKQESMPDISLPVVFVSTVYPAPPKDVMENVTKVLEKRIVGIEGMKKVSSTSNDNFSAITVELVNGRSPDDAKRDIESAIKDIKLPVGASEPKVSKFGSSDFPVYFAAVHGNNNMNQEELNRIYEDVIEPTLSAMDGIDHVDSVGQQEATLKLKLNINAINNYGLTPALVSQSIQTALMTSPAGKVDFSGSSQSVRIESDLNTIYNLENMKITSPKGDIVLLKDISKVEAISDSKFIARLDGSPAIGLTLFKGKDANTVRFADEVDKLFAGWTKEYPNLQFTPVYNAANDVKKSINGMLKEGILGAILASVMILLFLKNVRMTMIVLVSIPLSILTTLCVMASLDITLNVMTLGGLTIAVGRVVDDSIVVIENIYSELQQARERNESVIKLATSRVASAITSSTLTTAGVFLPIAFVGGVLGDIFRPFAITLVVALLSSLIVALTVIPMLAMLLVLNNDKIKHHDEEHVGKFTAKYKSILSWSLNNPKKTVLVSFLAFVISIGGTVPFLPFAFMPDSESNKQVQYTLKLPQETSIESMDLKVKEIETVLKEAKDSAGQPAFDYFESMVGYDMQSTSGERVAYRASIIASVSKASDAKKMAEEYKNIMLGMVPKGSEVEGALLAGSMGGSSDDFSYLLKGEDLNQLVVGAELIKQKLKEFPELKDIKDSLNEKKMQVVVSVDQNKARVYGLSSAQITDTVRLWLAEASIGDIKFDNVTFATQVMVDDDFKNSMEKLGRITMTTSTGAVVALNDIAKIRQVEAPAAITREMQEQYVKITAKIDSKDKGGMSTKVTEALKSVSLPGGIRTQVQGVNEDIQESFGQMAVAMGAAIFLVFLVLVIAFGNASAPFVILFSLPLAAIGGFLGLLIAGESINITSLIGFLMLIGVVVTNAIVLIDRVQQLRKEGLEMREAVVKAGLTRLRPIIMTAGATILSLLPLGLGFSEGSLISKGLAVVVIGGLVTSTLLTLVVVPVVYEIIDRMKVRISRLFNKKGNRVTAANAAANSLH
ncbi:efflux RND transporter permease subunit [Paenibacillus radicis (ex Xue et al. 2023)]|uniref:Efflux RND transporter permease subunit n=1 Tax=Paenibacillus radicis (ex Xue et al. 2023) TaxID=2972489 RepID=A0ABT1YEN6_9BACL|nr:efflux RND transporter permease subunit [Paenibacillus radicis (ex Xue et al. 2023)]MCR8631657.1 efflux RND transporter permease subunit [Paenibacillus radicis (ex Xue et al. 2023)]